MLFVATEQVVLAGARRPATRSRACPCSWSWSPAQHVAIEQVVLGRCPPISHTVQDIPLQQVLVAGAARGHRAGGAAVHFRAIKPGDRADIVTYLGGLLIVQIAVLQAGKPLAAANPYVRWSQSPNGDPHWVDCYTVFLYR